jgi:hypothetical protein
MHCAWPVAFWKKRAAHGSQLPALRPALLLPTLHAMQTPALAPPQPLRSAPECPQPAHAEHDSAPATALNVAARHASQCKDALVRGSEAPASPRLPAVHASQLVFPLRAWNLPKGHAVHCALSASIWKNPAAHGWQRAGDGSFASATNVPGKHGS